MKHVLQQLRRATVSQPRRGAPICSPDVPSCHDADAIRLQDEGTRRRLVPVAMLEVLLGNRFPAERLMIKIDVEGRGHAVLAGAANTLQRDPSPTWLVEVCLTKHHPGGRNPNFAAAFETFWRYGYEARTAEADQRTVRPADVSRWIAAGKRDFGCINFLFTRDAST
jgi:hypothetical protein